MTAGLAGSEGRRALRRPTHAGAHPRARSQAWMGARLTGRNATNLPFLLPGISNQVRPSFADRGPYPTRLVNGRVNDA